MNVLGEIVGDSPGIRQLREQLEQIQKRAATAPRPPPILLRGETGTGKGLVARTLHRTGPRADKPFVDVNCAAIPETLLEAELFGYERGAFTDARQAKPGLFQLAHHGTLFLDEIGTLSPALQAKLLKVLEDGLVRRLGATRPEPVDVWIVSATNDDLAEAMRARRFREDLYHRLALLSLELPPLREREADILLLAERFLARACADYGLAPKTFAHDAAAALAAYGWPGNVRELGNVIERVALLADDPVVTAAALGLPEAPGAVARPGAPAPARSSRDEMRAHLLDVLTETGWNISRTAVRLGVARNTVLARMARFGLRDRPSPAPRRHEPASGLTDVSGPSADTSRATWEQRHVALLHVALIDARGPFEKLVAKVETFGGVIDELGRSAFVAAFGLEPIEDAPVRAALAALAVAKAAERAKSADGAGPHVKIVVHAAHVLVSWLQGVGAIDLESKRTAWTTIDALAGLDQLDTIVVSEACAPFLERRFELTPAPPSDARAVPFRRLRRRESTGFGLGGRPLSPFVGRDSELRLVTERVADAARGHGQLIGVVGEPGVGKSRFVYELTQGDAMHGWHVLRCGGVSHGSATPFLPAADLLRRYFAIEDADDPQVIREKVGNTVAARREELRSHLAPLLSLLDIAVEDSSWRQLDPTQQRRRIQEAVKRLLLDESRRHPLVLIVEDLHWIDTATQGLLDGVVESLPTARLLLLVNYRPEYQHRWGSKSYYSQLRLDALAPERASELVRAVLGDDPALEPLTRLLVERGTPFFIEESIQTLVETGALVGERGAYRVTKPISAFEIPATVHTMLASRIERLPADDKALLQTASVIGNDVPLALLHAVASAAEDEVQRGLQRLRGAELLYETRFFPDAEYTFKHALTHDVTYGTVLPDHRTHLHARVVGAIERVYPDRLTEHVERLAHHAVRGGLWDQAVMYLRQVGIKAITRAAYQEAVTALEQALAALEHLPEGRATLERAIDLRLDLKTALFPLGAFERIGEALRLAERLATTLADQKRLGLVYVDLCHTTGLAGLPAEAIVVGEKARGIAESLGDARLQLAANIYLGGAYHRTGDYRRAEAILKTALQSLEDSPQLGLAGARIATVRGYLATIFTDWGHFAEGFRHAREGLRIAEAVNNPVALANISWIVAYVHLEQREIEDAIRLFERGQALTREWSLPYFAASHSSGLGYAYALSGRTAEGIPLLERGLADYVAMGHRYTQSIALGYLGEAYLLADRLQDALDCAGRALTVAREWGLRRNEARVLHLLGAATARHDAPARAEGYYREALALAEELGMRPLVAHCHMGLGRLFERLSKHDDARAHLTMAATMYRALDMPLWLEQAEAASERAR